MTLYNKLPSASQMISDSPPDLYNLPLPFLNM